MKLNLSLEQSIEEIADNLAQNEFCIIDDFLDEQDIKALHQAITFHREEDNFKKAGIGNAHLFQVDKEVRGDYIKWISREEAQPGTLVFLDKIEALMQSLSRILFLSLKDYECHFAIYPPGTFYEKHLDQFKSTSNRKISFAFYLNQSWKKGDGGELRLHREEIVDIEPQAGRLALFRSDTVEHEVLITTRDRYSITGWMRDRPIDLPLY
ncbi:MAG: 2OG-Fe(II) oxygenase [Owenweeksia sp.]